MDKTELLYDKIISAINEVYPDEIDAAEGIYVLAKLILELTGLQAQDQDQITEPEQPTNPTITESQVVDVEFLKMQETITPPVDQFKPIDVLRPSFPLPPMGKAKSKKKGETLPMAHPDDEDLFGG